MLVSCNLLGCYYFYCQYKIRKAMKYMYKGLKYITKHKIQNATYVHSLAHMQWIIGNFDECIRLNQLEVSLIKKSEIKKKKQKEIAAMKCENLKKCNLRNNYYLTKQRIKNYSKFYASQQDKIFLNRVKKYINDSKYYNIINNVIRLKQCNYIECNRKDLKSFSVCKFCKSAYYCCRQHQKKDWNTNHRKYCVRNEKRVYPNIRSIKLDKAKANMAIQLFTVKQPKMAAFSDFD
eukprot:64977_1